MYAFFKFRESFACFQGKIACNKKRQGVVHFDEGLRNVTLQTQNIVRVKSTKGWSRSCCRQTDTSQRCRTLEESTGRLSNSPICHASSSVLNISISSSIRSSQCSSFPCRPFNSSPHSPQKTSSQPRQHRLRKGIRQMTTTDCTSRELKL